MNWLLARRVAVAGITLSLVFAPLAPAQEKASAKDKDPILLQSLGALTGVYLFQTHTTLGMIHDGKAKGVFDDTVAKHQLFTIINMANLVDKQLALAAKAGLNKDDQQAFETFRSVNAQLQREAMLLKKVWESKDKKDEAAFAKQRGETFAKIANLLGIQQKKG
jgi:hypothetical protein